MVDAQISHGGNPLFPKPSLLRANASDLFIEMPDFNLDSLLQDDLLNEGNMRGAFRFANKFHTEIRKGEAGQNFTLNDGTKIWQVGIRSKGAFSINVLFSEYHIPQGAKLFVYSLSTAHILGAFTHENNSDDQILPLSPVMGEEIIIEYSEPADADFEGRLSITEVNHDYKDIFKYEPQFDSPKGECIPDIACLKEARDISRSAVLLIINGNSGCSGTLLNNTSGDGTPYLLTAAHCLNGSFSVKNPDYNKVAGSIIAFFNYEKSICNTKYQFKGSQEMSLAGTSVASIIEPIDIALLKFKETPPDYFRPYYAGWTIDYDKASQTGNTLRNYPYTNIHHPAFGMKKFAYSNDYLGLISLSLDVYTFMPNSHWHINREWTQGATLGGSSGSGLFDNNNLLVGGLTGGNSECNGTEEAGGADFFFALFRGWDYGDDPKNKLKTYLDPLNTRAISCKGMDPYAAEPFGKLSNADYNNTETLENTSFGNDANKNYLFGHNSLETEEFAEEFYTDKPLILSGAYFFCPKVVYANLSEVTIKVYKGDNGPGEQIGNSQQFKPVYKEYYRDSGTFYEKIKRMSGYATESFVKLDEDIVVEGKFYIAYQITYPSDNSFSVFNAKLDPRKKNTAWLRDKKRGWFEASNHPIKPIKTSLAIQPLLQYSPKLRIEKNTSEDIALISYDRKNKVLKIASGEELSGKIQIFSTTGVLIFESAVDRQNDFNINSPKMGSIGIVRLQTGKGSQTSKILF
ncbi:hypothetical protein AwDysgo_01670 [Bacteroidales bacterium]|nr:hypothetical protein AwDysgo_01670 [Bacteroidales bacterium]